MTSIAFSVYILGSGVAVIAAYALMMSILQRELNMAWIRGEAALLSISSAIALKAGFMSIVPGSLLDTAAYGLLLLGTLLAFGVVIFHRFKLTDGTYTEKQHPLMRSIAICFVGIFILQLLVLMAATAGF